MYFVQFRFLCVSIVQNSVDGLIISNTTVSRSENLISSHQKETGGLSGAPLKHLSTLVLRDMYSLTQGFV